eukprot:1147339-Pelagomonas_calceolata.AAC.2
MQPICEVVIVSKGLNTSSLRSSGKVETFVTDHTQMSERICIGEGCGQLESRAGIILEACSMLPNFYGGHKMAKSSKTISTDKKALYRIRVEFFDLDLIVKITEKLFS